MEDKLVLPEVLAAHELKPEWIVRPEEFRKEIQQYLEMRTGYADLLTRNLTVDEWNLAKNTGTNLTSLSRRRIDYLIQHAENLTELQIKLYCPTILPTPAPTNKI